MNERLHQLLFFSGLGLAWIGMFELVYLWDDTLRRNWTIIAIIGAFWFSKRMTRYTKQ